MYEDTQGTENQNSQTNYSDSNGNDHTSQNNVGSDMTGHTVMDDQKAAATGENQGSAVAGTSYGSSSYSSYNFGTGGSAGSYGDYDYKNGNPLMPDNTRYSRYKKNKDGTYSIKNPLENHCWKMWHSSVITWDGSMVPCCFDKDAKHKLGDLQHDSFRELWHGKTYNRFRQAVLTSRSSIDICANCTEGGRVWTKGR